MIKSVTALTLYIHPSSKMIHVTCDAAHTISVDRENYRGQFKYLHKATSSVKNTFGKSSIRVEFFESKNNFNLSLLKNISNVLPGTRGNRK